jgi:hypothetical protein
MAVTIVGGSGSISGNVLAYDPTAPAQTFSEAYTCPATTKVLVVIDAAIGVNNVATKATQVTYNGLPLTYVRNSYVSSSQQGCFVSFWYLLNPPTGSSYTLRSTYGSSVLDGALIPIPLNGVSVIGATSTNTANNSTPAVTPATVADANSLVLSGLSKAGSSAVTDPGGNQTNLVNLNQFNCQCLADSAAGNATGVFSWTAGSSPWAASSVIFYSTVTPSIAWTV